MHFILEKSALGQKWPVLCQCVWIFIHTDEGLISSMFLISYFTNLCLHLEVIEIIPSIFISHSDKHILWAYANLHNWVLTIAVLDVMYWAYGILSA